MESGHSLRYVEVVADLAREYHGATALIDKYTQDLLNAINSSSSAAEAFHHTIHFLKGVGARNLHELLPKGVYLDSMALPRANLAFRALTLPEARTYRLKLTYRPDWLVPARYSVLFGLIVLILLVIFVIFRAGKPQVGLENCSPQTNRK